MTSLLFVHLFLFLARVETPLEGTLPSMSKYQIWIKHKRWICRRLHNVSWPSVAMKRGEIIRNLVGTYITKAKDGFLEEDLPRIKR